MNYKNYEEAVRRLAIPYMAKIDYQDIYHDCNDGEHFIDEDVNLLFSLIKECEQLDKALDRACEELENKSYVKGLGQVGMNYAEWKEYLLNGEEE